MATVTVLTNAGEEWSAGRLAGTALTEAKYVAWGSGEGTAAKGNVILFNEESESRVTGTVTVEGTGASAKCKVVATLTADSAKTISEVGVFTASTNGTLVIHETFDEQELAEGDTLTFSLTINP